MAMALCTIQVILFNFSNLAAGSAIGLRGDNLWHLKKAEENLPNTQTWTAPPRQRFVRSKGATCPPSQPDPAASIFNFLSSAVLMTNVAINMIISINTNNNNNNNNDNNNNNNDNNFNSNSLMFTSMNTNMNTAMLPGRRRRRSGSITNDGCSCKEKTPETVGLSTSVLVSSSNPASEVSSIPEFSWNPLSKVSRVPEISWKAESEVSNVIKISSDLASEVFTIPEVFWKAEIGVSSVPKFSHDSSSATETFPGKYNNSKNSNSGIFWRQSVNSTDAKSSWIQITTNILNWNTLECVSWFICHRLKTKQESSIADWVMENMTVSIMEIEISSYLSPKQIVLLRRAIFEGRYSTNCDHLWRKCHALV
ncbi:tyrosine-protein phosphatase 3-like [Palaemon carinicauda]|uniref:tyrosine-protein phosphatase 3-like n=1 Tax=Palaemon carinicauda TaxID=392227 RepID=UPI0035B69190